VASTDPGRLIRAGDRDLKKKKSRCRQIRARMRAGSTGATPMRFSHGVEFNSCVKIDPREPDKRTEKKGEVDEKKKDSRAVTEGKKNQIPFQRATAKQVKQTARKKTEQRSGTHGRGFDYTPEEPPIALAEKKARGGGESVTKELDGLRKGVPCDLFAGDHRQNDH